MDVGQIPPWLIPRESPGNSLLQGVQVGSMLARNVLAGREFALRQKEHIIQQENELKLREGMAAFGAYMGSVKEWDSPEAEAGAYEIAAQYPWITSSPAFVHGIQNFRKAREASNLAKSREKIATQRATTSADIAWLNANVKDATQRQRLEEIRLKDELGLDTLREREALRYDYNTMLQSQKQAGAETIQGIKGEQAENLVRLKSELKNEDLKPENIVEVGGAYYIRAPGGGLHKVPLFNDAEQTEYRSIARRQEDIQKQIGKLTDSKADLKLKQELETTQLNLKTRALILKNEALDRLKKVVPIPSPITPRGSPAPKRVRVRERATGQTGWWEGGDVPPEYEIIQP